MGRAKTIKTYPPESRLSVGFQDFPTLHPIRSLFFTGKNPPCWGSQPIIPSTGQPVSPPLYGIGHHQCGWRIQLHFPPFLSPVLSCLVFPSFCVYCFCLHFFFPFAISGVQVRIQKCNPGLLKDCFLQMALLDCHSGVSQHSRLMSPSPGAWLVRGVQQFRTAIQIRQSRSAADAREIACSITVALSCRGCVFNQTWS